MPSVSVIVPLYNVEPYLHRCVDSILVQTFTDFELILIDDGSTDGSTDICDEYERSDHRVTVIHQENQGVSAARNTGIERAFENGSEWLTFIDSDDYVIDKYLEVLLEAARGCGIAVGARVMTEGEEIPQSTEYTSSLFAPADLYLAVKGNFSISAGKLFKTELFSNVRYPVGKIYEDSYVTYKILFQFEKVPFVPQPLYAHFKNPKSITMDDWTPARLDALGAVAEQIEFLTERGYLEIAAVKFRQYVTLNRRNQDQLDRWQGAPKKERVKIRREVKRELRSIIIRYRRYHWCRWWCNRYWFFTVLVAFGPRFVVNLLMKLKRR